MPELLQQRQIQARCLGGLPPLIFRPKWGPKGQKKYFWDRPLLLISESGWPGPPPLIWRRSGSANVQYWFSLDETLIFRDEMLISGMRHLICLSRNEMRLVHVAYSFEQYCRTAFTVSSTVKGWDSRLGTENWQISVKIVLSYANVAFFTV